jgi:hypothetical protein
VVSRDASAKSVGVIVVQSSFLCVKRISCLSCSMHVACALVRAGFSCVGVRSKSVCALPSEVSESELMASVLLVFVCVRSQNRMSCLACFFAKLFLMAAWILAACEVLVVGNCVARRGRCVVGGGVTHATSGLVFVVAVVKGVVVLSVLVGGVFVIPVARGGHSVEGIGVVPGGSQGVRSRGLRGREAKRCTTLGRCTISPPWGS